MKSKNTNVSSIEANITTDTKGKQVKRTRHRRRNEIKEEKCNNSRGRKKIGESFKKKDDRDVITKPAIESSNPFFIAVCAPETYKPRISSSISTNVKRGSSDNTSSFGMNSTDDKDGGEINNRTNVFLRQRIRHSMPSSSNQIHSNRFIHHPLLQHSREIQNHSNTGSESTIKVENNPHSKTDNNILELSNENQFPSLGSTPTTTTTNTKLNFKEMVMRNSGSSSSTSNHTTNTTEQINTNVAPNTPVDHARIHSHSFHKSLSSNNIFLAAFQSQNDDNDCEYDKGDDHHDDVGTYGPPYALSSSVLIDSCDKKYDKLYK